jgi:hypothetical protein
MGTTSLPSRPDEQFAIPEGLLSWEPSEHRQCQSSNKQIAKFPKIIWSTNIHFRSLPCPIVNQLWDFFFCSDGIVQAVTKVRVRMRVGYITLWTKAGCHEFKRWKAHSEQQHHTRGNSTSERGYRWCRRRCWSLCPSASPWGRQSLDDRLAGASPAERCASRSRFSHLHVTNEITNIHRRHDVSKTESAALTLDE